MKTNKQESITAAGGHHGMMKAANMQQTSQEAEKAIFEKLRPQLFTNIKDEALRAKIADSFLAKLLHTFDEEEFSEGVVAAYAKYFDDSEIKELVRFNPTPAGQKFNKVAGNLAADLMDLGQTVAKHDLPDIFNKLQGIPGRIGREIAWVPRQPRQKKRTDPRQR